MTRSSLVAMLAAGRHLVLWRGEEWRVSILSGVIGHEDRAYVYRHEGMVGGCVPIAELEEVTGGLDR